MKKKVKFFVFGLNFMRISLLFERKYCSVREIMRMMFQNYGDVLFDSWQ